MDAILKQKWIDALRSGKFQQGREQLRKGDCFCCLGVLACEMGLEISPLGHSISSDKIFDPFAEYEQLPIDHKKQSRLIKMNDQEFKTFTEIASYIEQKL